MKEKKWIGPKLTVLSRGRPEEVLTKVCKHAAIESGPRQKYSACRWRRWCDECFSNTNMK